MNEAFIWLSGLCFINKHKLLMARNFFPPEFSLKINMYEGSGKNIIFPT